MAVDRRRALLSLWMPLATLLLAAFSLSGPLKPTEGLLTEQESAYNFIQVVQRGDTRYLLLNEGQGIHSVYNPNQLATSRHLGLLRCGPVLQRRRRPLRNVRSLALVGLAAGTIARQYTAVFGADPD